MEYPTIRLEERLVHAAIKQVLEAFNSKTVEEALRKFDGPTIRAYIDGSAPLATYRYALRRAFEVA